MITHKPIRRTLERPLEVDRANAISAARRSPDRASCAVSQFHRSLGASPNLEASFMTDDDVQELIALLEQAQTEWVNGTFNSLFDVSQGTIFAPFGGPAFGGPGFSEGGAAMASQFHDGTTQLEVVNTIVCGDVVCLVMVERNTVRFEGDSEPRRWVLRSTMLYRRDGETWTMLHRHADPLIDRRDLGATLELLPREH
jgi:ketosteroid isomerase-like protein